MPWKVWFGPMLKVRGFARGREGVPSHAALSWKVVVSDWWWTIWKRSFGASGADGDIAL